MREWWKFTAWPWIRDHAWPFVESGMKAWFDQTLEYPGVAVANIVLGGIVASLVL